MLLVFSVINGEFRQYKGPRDKDSFTSFVEEKKWEQVEPISNWKAPNSFQMSVVSSFFKLSQTLRVRTFYFFFDILSTYYLIEEVRIVHD